MYIINLISILLFYFLWINEIFPIFIISTISFGYILKHAAFFFLWKASLDYNEVSLYLVVMSNYGEFILVDALLIVIGYMLFIFPIKYCRQKCECCNNVCCCLQCVDELNLMG